MVEMVRESPQWFALGILFVVFVGWVFANHWRKDEGEEEAGFVKEGDIDVLKVHKELMGGDKDSRKGR